jgi:hypothetical protein
MGFEPQQPRSTLESVNEFAERMALGIEEAKVALTKAKDEYAMYYNHQCEPAPVFAPGDCKGNPNSLSEQLSLKI